MTNDTYKELWVPREREIDASSIEIEGDSIWCDFKLFISVKEKEQMEIEEYIEETE